MRRYRQLLWLAAFGSVAPAAAQSVVLHEFVPDVDPHEPVRGLSEPDGSAASIVYDGEVLPAPDLEPSAATAPSMVAPAGDGMFAEQPGQRSPSFRPDRQTQLEGRLSYYAAFNPSIAPFKRVTALDRVVLGADQHTPVLVLGASAAERLEVGAQPDPDARIRDQFWGEARLDFSEGAQVPLPSVSPESRILSLRSEPAVGLTILRDGAGNYSARLGRGSRATQLAVAFLTDAPRGYFGAAIPAVALDTLRASAPPLPASVRARGLVFAAELGLSPRSDLRTALHALVAHFRAFEESSSPPEDSGDIYLDLVRAQKGICRHRAYGFVITAQALGIDARFVQNEAHSWVEVRLPELGFMRIDLGGAAAGLDAHGTTDRPVYRPLEPDLLPRPAAYEESYSQASAAGGGGGRRPGLEQLAGRWVGPSASGSGSDAAFLGPGGATGAPQDGRRPLTIAVDQRRLSVLRGRVLRVSGRVVGPDGAGVGGQRVELSLSAPDRRERMLLGVAVTAADGAFNAELGIPPGLDVGDYRLIAIAPGDAQHRPAVAP